MGQHGPVHAVLSRYKLNLVACVDHVGGPALDTIDPQLCGNGGLPVEGQTLSVHIHHDALSIAAQQIPIAISVHHQKLQRCQPPIAEELSRSPVEENAIAVADQPQPRRNGDPQGGGVLRVVELYHL